MHEPTAVWDAIVVGGGPAGSAAARALASRGARTLLLERARHPRYKACGGGVPQRAVRHLGGPLDSVVEAMVRGIEISHASGRQVVRWADAPLASMVMRACLDRLLLERAEAAGAEVRQGEGVLGVEQSSGAVEVHTEQGTHRARYVLGADGATGRIGRSVGLGNEMAKSAAWELEIAAAPSALARWEGLANVDASYRPWGYGWVFPKAGRLSVGLVLAPGRGNGIRARTDRYLKRLGLDGAEVQEARGHPIRYRRRGNQISDGRVLLLGDAAGLADELTAEGIGYAAHSGLLAAEAVVAALASDGEVAARYEASIDRAIQPELDAARAISRVYYWCVRTWPALALGVSQRVDYLSQAFFRVMQGRSTYRKELQRVPGLALVARLS